MACPITLAVEGATDAVVARRLLDEAGLEPMYEYVKNGKAALDRSLPGYNNAARFSCWLVLRDLDTDADCAPALRNKLLPAPSARMRLHIPVHAVEAWLMGDAEAFSRFFSVSLRQIPANPEVIPDPKRAVVNLARRSRRRSIQEAMVPPPGSSAKVGPGYAASLIQFATENWRPDAAERSSESLARLRAFLRVAATRAYAPC